MKSLEEEDHLVFDAMGASYGVGQRHTWDYKRMGSQYAEYVRSYRPGRTLSLKQNSKSAIIFRGDGPVQRLRC